MQQMDRFSPEGRGAIFFDIVFVLAKKMIPSSSVDEEHLATKILPQSHAAFHQEKETKSSSHAVRICLLPCLL